MSADSQALRVLLTGASGGIGSAVAQRLLEANAQVVGVCRSKVPSGVSGRATSAMEWLQADLTDANALQSIAEAAQHRGVNSIIHAAGVPAFSPAASISPAQAHSVLQANLWAPMVLTQALLPYLRTLPAARVVFIGSALGRIGVPGYSLYGASKAGLHTYAEALRRELQGSTVRVQLLAPRATKTTFNSSVAQRYAEQTGSHSDSPEQVAGELMRLLDGAAAERFLGWPEKLVARVNGALGPWLDRAFVRHRTVLHP